MLFWIFFFLNGSELKRVRSWKDLEHCEIMMVPENPERLLKKGSAKSWGFPCGRLRKTLVVAILTICLISMAQVKWCMFVCVNELSKTSRGTDLQKGVIKHKLWHIWVLTTQIMNKHWLWQNSKCDKTNNVTIKIVTNFKSWQSPFC